MINLISVAGIIPATDIFSYISSGINTTGDDSFML